MAVFRVEKTRDFTIMSNHHLRNKALSLKAKGLQSLMLSLPESWDFTTKGLSFICKDGVDSITSTLNELEKHGYLTRTRLRDERGRLTDIEYTIHEQPIDITQEKPDSTPFSPKRENPRLDNPVLEKPILGEPEQGLPVLENPAQLSINLSSTQKEKIDSSRTNPSIYPGCLAEQQAQLATRPSIPAREPEAPRSRDRPDSSALSLRESRPSGVRDSSRCQMDAMDKMESYRELILDNIEYDCLVQQYGRERMGELVELLLETVCSKRDYIRVAGDEYPREVVKSRMLKLTSSHVEYAFDCIDKNTTKVRNIKAYLLTTLYNAPTTMDTYYRAEVNHDLYGL